MTTIRERLASLIPGGAFGRGVTILAGGSAAAQAVAVAASPILTRLYGPADFGVLAVYTSMVSLIGGLAAMSYHQAIPLPESEVEGANLLGLSLGSSVLLAGVTAVAVGLWGKPLVMVLDAPALVPWLWMVPLGVLGLSGYEVLTQWAVRTSQFLVVARTSLTRGIAQTGTQLGIGAGGWAPLGLVLGQLIGQWVGSGTLLRSAWHHDREAIQSIRFRTMGAAARRYRRFPQFTSPAVLMSSASIQAPPLLLAYFFGGAVTGFFALGSRVLMMPVQLVAKSASQVFFAGAAEAWRQGRLAVETEKIFSGMLRISVPFALLIGMAAPDLFSVVFGSRWWEAGLYAQWLTPWLLLVFVGFPLTPLISVLERQPVGMVFQAALLSGRLGGLLVGGIARNPMLAIALFGAASAACWGWYVVWLLRLGGSTWGSLRRSAATAIIRGLMWSLPLIAAMITGAGDALVTLVFFVNSGLVMWALMRGQTVWSAEPESEDTSIGSRR